jgi:hypothetical protein
MSRHTPSGSFPDDSAVFDMDDTVGNGRSVRYGVIIIV